MTDMEILQVSDRPNGKLIKIRVGSTSVVVTSGSIRLNTSREAVEIDLDDDVRVNDIFAREHDSSGGAGADGDRWGLVGDDD